MANPSPRLRPQSGLVGLCLEFTKDRPSPEVFRLWTTLHGIGSAVERRVWTRMDAGLTYPNMFVFLVGPPDIGKTVSMKPIIEFLIKSGACIIGPNDITKQGLLDSLYNSGGRNVLIDNELMDFHYLSLHITEIANFMSKYDQSLAGLLTELWDCPPFNDEAKRHKLGKMIPFPGLSLLVAAASGSLGSTIPNEAWDSGFMARVVMVYADQRVKSPNPFRISQVNLALETQIVERFKTLKEFKGEMKWTEPAQDAYIQFEEKLPSPPTHSRLTHYNARRPRHLCKLMMIAALSEERMMVTDADFDTAIRWLFHTESTMSNIFLNMTNSEDGKLLEEIAHQVRVLYKENGGAVQHYQMYRLMTKIVPHNRVESFLEAAVNGAYINRIAGTSGDNAEYTPS